MIRRRSALFFAHLLDYSLPPFLLVTAFYFIQSTIAHPMQTYWNDHGEPLTFSYTDQPEFHRAIFGLYVMGPITFAATILYTIALLRTSHFPIKLYCIKTFLLILAAISIKAVVPAEPLLLFSCIAIATWVLFAFRIFQVAAAAPILQLRD